MSQLNILVFVCFITSSFFRRGIEGVATKKPESLKPPMSPFKKEGCKCAIFNFNGGLLLLFLTFCLNTSADPGTEINFTQSCLIHLAQQIQQDDPARKYNFLLITLQQMANSYAEETEKVALEKQKTLKKHAKAVHWQYSSYRYLDSIEAAILQLDMEENPDFFISKQNRLRY